MNKNSAFVIEVVTAAGLVTAILIAQIDYVAGLLFLLCGGALWATSPQLSHAGQDKHRRVELLGGVGAFLIVLALVGFLVVPALKFLKFNSSFGRAPDYFIVFGLALLWSAQALYQKMSAHDKPTGAETTADEGLIWRALGVIERNGLHVGGLALIALGLFLGRFAGKLTEVHKPAVWGCIAVVAIGVVIVSRTLIQKLVRKSVGTNRTTS
jgi:drug/metabolite transporter (DMT)-like permease